MLKTMRKLANTFKVFENDVVFKVSFLLVDIRPDGRNRLLGCLSLSCEIYCLSLLSTISDFYEQNIEFF